MKYNFETTQLNREGRSSKWNLMYNQKKDAKFIPLTVADMEFETAPEIKKALSDYVNTQILGYTSPTDSYYDAVLDWFKTIHNIEFNRDEMLQTTGVISALHALIEVLTNEDDEVLITSPVYGHFFSSTTSTNRRVLDVPLKRDNHSYTMDFEAMDKALEASECKLMILCNPHNPIGRVWTLEELNHLYTVTKKHGVTVISDEIHADIIMPGHEFVSFRKVDPECIVCTSASKTFNLAALQTANIFVPNKKVRNKLIQRDEAYGIHNPCALGYVATEAAYTQAREWYKESLNVINTNYELLKDLLKDSKYEIAPLEGTYLLWVGYSKYCIDEKHFVKTLLLKEDCPVSQGSSYGENGKGYIRINLALPTRYIYMLAEKLLDVVEKL